MDILGLGAVAVDDIITIDSYPPPDSKCRVLHRERHCGGLTATALVAAARFGAACSYAGQLGTDDDSVFASQVLEREGVDLSYALVDAGAGVIRSTVIVGRDDGSRTILAQIPRRTGASAHWPALEVVTAARVLFVDTLGLEGMVRAARIARANGIPVVADLEGGGGAAFEELLGLSDHLVVPEGFARSWTGAEQPGEAARALWQGDRAAVVVTCGAAGSWWLGPDSGEAWHQPADSVEAVDTTGCGDVFHGVYAAALAGGMSLEERIRYAAAAAGMKATKPGGQTGIPTRPEVEAFIEERSR